MLAWKGGRQLRGGGGRASRCRLRLQIRRRKHLKDLGAHACEQHVPDGNDIAAWATRGWARVIKSLVSFIPLGRVAQACDKVRQQVSGLFPTDGGHLSARAPAKVFRDEEE